MLGDGRHTSDGSLRTQPVLFKRRKPTHWEARQQHKLRFGFCSVLTAVRPQLTGCGVQVLRLDKHPTSADIKASFRKLSMAVHPDKNASPSSTEAMRRVTKAYQALMAGAK